MAHAWQPVWSCGDTAVAQAAICAHLWLLPSVRSVYLQVDGAYTLTGNVTTTLRINLPGAPTPAIGVTPSRTEEAGTTLALTAAATSCAAGCEQHEWSVACPNKAGLNRTGEATNITTGEKGTRQAAAAVVIYHTCQLHMVIVGLLQRAAPCCKVLPSKRLCVPASFTKLHTTPVLTSTWSRPCVLIAREWTGVI